MTFYTPAPAAQGVSSAHWSRLAGLPVHVTGLEAT
jgi:hypothetical protein